MNISQLIPFFSLLTAMLLWGSSFVAMKLAFMEYDPLVVIFGRMVVASLCFLPFIKVFCRLKFSRRDIYLIMFMGACEPCLYFLLEAAALQNTSASQAAMITTLLPLMIALCAGLFLGEKITGRIIIGFLLAGCGAIWLSLAARVEVTAPHPILGNFLEFLAMTSAVGYIITAKYLSRSLPPLFITAVQAFIGTFFFLPLLFLPAVELPTTFSIKATAATVYLGVFVTVGAYGLYNYSLSKIPASKAGAFINIIPVFTIILGWLILDEQLSIWQLVACGLVFSGVLLSLDNKANKAHV